MFEPNNPALFLNGIPLEEAVAWFIEKMGLGSILDHNNFNPHIYPNDKHNIVDAELKNKLLYECTNPKSTTSMNDSIMENKLGYFWRKDPEHLLMWVLIVSYANFSDHIKQLINEYGIVLIELKETATESNLSTFKRHLYHSKLYGLIKRLKPYHKGSPMEKKPAQLFSITTLPQYSRVSSSPISSNSNYLHRTANTKLTDSDRAILEELSKPVRPSNLEWLRYKWDVLEAE